MLSIYLSNDVVLFGELISRSSSPTSVDIHCSSNFYTYKPLQYLRLDQLLTSILLLQQDLYQYVYLLAHLL